MRVRARRLILVLLFVIPAPSPSALCAQDRPPSREGGDAARVTLVADVLLYGDNTEFRNPFREGETLLGPVVRLYGVAHVGDKVDLSLGFVGSRQFGSDRAFDVAKPAIALTVRGARSAFTFGTFLPARDRRLLEPERSGPHALLPPIQVETLTFTRPHEAGLRWTLQTARVAHEAWINWQRLNTRAHRERFDAGIAGTLRVAGPFAMPFQLHVVHEGGQLFAAGPVRDSTAAALGVRAAGKAGPFERAELEVYGLASRYVPDRSLPSASRSGAGFLGRASAERAGWRGHVLFFRGDDFVKDEGDPNYSSLRRDGSRWRGVRDYAEAGLTRMFHPAPGVMLAAAFRMHRTERHYEYSYRVIGAAALKWKIR